MAALEAIKFSMSHPASLKLLDQRLLPLETTFVDIPDPRACWTAIKDMVVRGAPAIAIAAALSLAVDLVNGGEGRQFESADAAAVYIKEQLDYLVTSRPTAVNLEDAAKKLTAVANREATTPGATSQSVTRAVIFAADAMYDEDVEANKALGRWGAEAVLAAVAKSGKEGGARLLTHCNAGSLATAAYGTALGVVRATAEQGQLLHAYCTETRPYNQGSRLTAYELVHEGYPATLVCDSAAASLMAAGKVDAVVVGADRVAANGDTANKIGTYALAVHAAHHGIPFFVAAPTTTLDPDLAHGRLIPIEEREATEITHFRGEAVAAPGINVWNPAFDVTPGALIQGIVTEKGVIPRDGTAHAVTAFLESHGLRLGPQENGEVANGVEDASAGSDIPGFRALNPTTVVDYLVERPDLARRVGPVDTRASWKVREVGDGNINYVYIVEGPSGALVLKQGLPYIRIAHDWKLSQERARFEAAALEEEAKHSPQHVPELYLYDESMAVIVMQYLAPPHIILRVALTEGRTFPNLARHVGSFLAQTLFHTSLFALDSTTWRRQVARFSNDNMSRLTEQVIFTDPYYAAPVNRHTSPYLDDLAELFREDIPLKAAITRLKALFVERQQALLHGDLHTGSFMVTEDTTYAIDPEFATYGPMAFDVCKMIANLLLAFFAADGHAMADGASRRKQQAWMLEAIVEIWNTFKSEFTGLWTSSATNGSAGDLVPPALFGPDVPHAEQALMEAQKLFFEELFRDTLRFAGAVMIRRVLGIAHVIDFEHIKDAQKRAWCESSALSLGSQLLDTPEKYTTIADVVEAAKSFRSPEFRKAFP